MEGEDDEESRENSTEESAEQLSEIEARLYSVIHYNDLSKPLDESITAQYDIEVTDKQIIVSLKGDSDDLVNEGIAQDNTFTPNSAAEEGESEPKLQKLCENDEKSVAETGRNLEENSERLADSKIIKIPTENIESLVNSETINDSEEESESVKQGHIKDQSNDCATGKGQTIEARQADNYCLNGGITPGKKKKKKKKIGRKQREKEMMARIAEIKNKMKSNAKEAVVDLTSDQEDSDCLVISDEKDLEISDESLVLNVESNDDPVPTSSSAGKSDSVESVKKKGSKLTKKQKKAKIKWKRRTYHCPKKWTASMVNFYCRTSKRLANFDHEAIIKEMRASNIPRECWAISKLDKKPSYSQYKNTRCDKCRQFGHVARFCMEPVKPIVCHMCGVQGHRESRCPERKCLNCGRPNENYIEMCSNCHLSISNGTFFCEICESRLHSKEFCPNVWRAFHITTGDGPLLVPHLSAGRRKHCSNCAGVGHLFYECRDTFHITPYALCAETPFVPDYSRIAQYYALLNNEPDVNIALQLEQYQYDALASDAGCHFLQALSDKENVTLRMEESSLTIEGKQVSYYTVCCAVQEFLAGFKFY